MSKLEKIGEAAIDLFDLHGSLDAVYEAFDRYTKNPSAETSGKLIGVLSSQLAGQLIERYIDKLIPHKGEEFLWSSLRLQFDNPRTMESSRQRTKLVKVSLGVIIGVYIESQIEEARNSEFLQDHVFQHFFPIYDSAVEGANSLLDWWDPLGVNRAMDEFIAPTKVVSFQDISNAQPQFQKALNQGSFGQDFYKDFTKWSSNALLNSANNLFDALTPTYNFDFSGFHSTPIGAFYDSRSLATDTAASIADKTLTLFDANRKGLTAAQLSALDTNNDGQLSGNELNTLNAWADLNENGQVDTDEMRTLAQRGVVSIRAADFSFYTQGNSLLAGPVVGDGPYSGSLYGGFNAGQQLSQAA